MKISLLLLVSACSSISLAQDPKANLDSLSWLAGCWEGRYGDGSIVSEQWMRSLGKMMMGMSRTVNDGKTVEYENVRLQQLDDGSIHYVARPSGQKEATFPLVKFEGRLVVFENPDHDFPQRIIYQLVPPDSLRARVEGTIHGKEKRLDFPYRKVKCD
jgi:hypothetical protein